MEQAPEAPAEAPAALEHDIVIEEGEHTKYPAPLSTHEKVLEDKELFLALLQDLCTNLQDAEPKLWRPTKFRVPTAAGQDLDLQRLYRCTTELGGAVAVTEHGRWPDVIKPMNFPSKVNTAAIRKIYSQLLWHFEQIYFNGAAGQDLAEPPELAAAAALQAATAAAHRQSPADVNAAAADGAAGRARSARRKGPSLAALIAAQDRFGPGLDDSAIAAAAAAGDFEDADEQGNSDAGSGDEQDGVDTITGPPRKSAAAAVAAGGSTAAAASPGRGGSAQPTANGTAAAAPKPRSRPPQQQNRGPVQAPGKTPELTAFLKAGRPRRDLTGAPVTGRVEARFDCGYFVSITVGGLQFGGVLYCPTGTGGSTQPANRGGGGGVKREESAAGDAVAAAAGGGRKAAGGGGKREAGAAGFEEGGNRGAKRRRSLREPNDPSLANKPKSAKTAFNFFAAEQWAALRGELGANAAPQDISRLIGERWSKASEDERAPFVAKAQEDKSRYEREMEDWRSSMEVVAAAAAADSAAAAAAAAAEGDADAEAAGGSQGGEAMDVDAAAVGVKQEQRSATPPKPLHPKIKLKMTGRHGTPPPAAAAAAVQEGADGADAGSTQQQQEKAAAVTAAAPLESPVLPDGPEPARQYELQQQQQQQVLQHPVADIRGPAAAAAAGGASLHPAAATVGLAVLEGLPIEAGGLLMGGAADEMQHDGMGAGGEQQ